VRTLKDDGLAIDDVVEKLDVFAGELWAKDVLLVGWQFGSVGNMGTGKNVGGWEAV
jgi:hypothetical protein